MPSAAATRSGVWPLPGEGAHAQGAAVGSDTEAGVEEDRFLSMFHAEVFCGQPDGLLRLKGLLISQASDRRLFRCASRRFVTWTTPKTTEYLKPDTTYTPTGKEVLT